MTVGAERDLVRGRGPMTPNALRAARSEQVWGHTGASIPSIESALASGAIREVERRETCGACEGKGSVWGDAHGGKTCPVCYGFGTVPVTYLATPEQGAILDALRVGPRTAVQMALLLAFIGMDAVPGDAGRAVNTLLVANWITRTEQEQERECGTCGGEGDVWSNFNHEQEAGFIACPDCKDGKQTVVVYELVAREPNEVNRT